MVSDKTERSTRTSAASSRSSSRPPDRNWVDYREPAFTGWRLPTTPFARFALMHGVSTAGDALVSFALAKTLFFVSPAEARGKVLLYLLLTLAPFAVVSPFVGPLIDRFAERRQWLVVGTSVARVVLCLFLARDYDTLALFPEAFTLLVLSKGYTVARSSLVPSIVTRRSELVRANSKLSLVAGIAGLLAAIPGGLASLMGPAWVLLLASLAFAASAGLASRLIVSDLVEEGARSELRGPRQPSNRDSPTFLTSMRLAALSMSVERGLIGFITFLVAFTFKREGAPTWWLGVVAGAGMVGLMIGSALAPRIRKSVDEMAMLSGGLIVTAGASLIAAFSAGKLATSFVALTVAVAASCGRLAFDSLIQREGNANEHGAVFARFETRFQLAWVLGALVPVAVLISRTVGLVVIGLIAAFAVVVQAGGERSLAQIDSTLQAGWRAWRRPARPVDTDWETGTREWLSDEDS